METTGRTNRWRLSHLKTVWLHGPRSGIVMVTAALSLVALLGVAALTIDLGRLAVATQRAQDVADASALGAVYQLPDQNGAITRLADVVGANNSANSWPAVSIAPNSDAIFYSPGSEVPHYGQLQSNQHAVTVTAHVNDEYTFARIAGLTDMHTKRSATAVVTQSGGGRAVVFAGDTAGNAITCSGTGMLIDGDMHSNGGVSKSGGPFTVTGQLRHGGPITSSGTPLTIEGGDVLITTPEQYPVDPPWNQGFAAVCAYFDRTPQKGNMSTSGFDNVIEPGLYLIDGNITFSGSGHILAGVTLVASGTISFSGAIHSVSAATEGMALVAYGTGGIKFSGAEHASSGTIFAPNGALSFSGGNFTGTSLIGKTVAVSGSGHTVSGGGGGGTSLRQVRLVY